MRRWGSIAVALLLAVAACKSATSDTPAKAPSSKKTGRSDAGTAGKGGSQSSEGSNTSTPNTAPDGGSTAASNDAGSSHDGGAVRRDAGSMSMSGTGGSTQMADAGSMTHGDAGTGMGTPDASLGDAQIGMEGSCCAEHSTPGCSNADLVVCVCEKLSTCCTTAWDYACVLLVKQKYCQPGIRDCVCGDGAGQKGQHSCCDVDWSDTFCDSVAKNQCGAASGCL
jgi:hypothetical protein